jgi:glycosyltransferase involved in cell wall biosynthesis
MIDRSYNDSAPEPGRKPRLALVLWNGNVGGAETFSVSLAARMRQFGADLTVVFVERPLSMSERLSTARIPHRSLGLERGREVLRHPRRYAAEVTRSGPDGALLVERGFMGAALRIGGYRQPIIAVEHGALLELPALSKPQRLLELTNYLSGAWADNAEVTVSDFMLNHTRQHPHTPCLRRIYNGIDPDRYAPDADPKRDRGADIVVGFAGRLIPGKGADHLIRALALVNREISAKLLIAGDGPERMRLSSLARALGIESKVDFVGIVDDLPSFWQGCDVAATPSDTFTESFSMVTLEAMTCGKPVVASRNGAIPELMVDGVTGTLVECGNVNALARALIDYSAQPATRRAHGSAARTRAIECFHIDACARAYLDLFSELSASRPWRPWRWPAAETP